MGIGWICCGDIADFGVGRSHGHLPQSFRILRLMDSATLNNRLKDRFQDVVLYLYPAAKIKGSKAHIGSIDGEKGDSMVIEISGPHIGRAVDFSNPENKSGTPLMLWSRARGVTYSASVREAKDWLGIKDDDYGMSANKPKKTYSSPDKKGLRSLDTNTKAMDYLCLERRLCPIVVAANKISETPDGETIVFPYIDETTGKACHLKYLKVDRETDPITGKQKKVMWASKDTKRCLFSKQTVPATAATLTLCEGEIDAVSWQSIGVPCCSIPMGVNDMDWIDIDWNWLERFEAIFVSFDMDSAGGEAVERIAKRLGLHRVRVVSLPHKDMNKCLQEGFTAADAQRVLDEAKAIEIAEIQGPSAYLDEVWNVFHPTAGQDGYATPWYPALPFRVKPSEVTVISGYSGAGKALSLDTPIPTPSGWSSMGALSVGDELFDETGSICRVVNATDVMHGRNCFRVEFSDGSHVIADGEHLWETWDSAAVGSLNRQRKKISRSGHNDQRNKCARQKIEDTNAIIEFIKNPLPRSHKFIKKMSALKLPEADLPIHPYLLGVWLGDGTSVVGNITKSERDMEIIERIRSLGYSVINLKLPPHKATGWRVDGLTTMLSALGVKGNKSIPVIYQRASIEQRIELLRGLMDTDGYASKEGSLEMCLSDEVLASDVHELIQGLGIKCSMKKHPSKLYGRIVGDRWRMHFTCDSFNPFHLTRKSSLFKRGFNGLDFKRIESISPVDSVPVKCIEVDSPNKLYVCGKGFVVTHNTCWINNLIISIMNQGGKVLDCSLEIKPARTLQWMSRQALNKRTPNSKEELEATLQWLSGGIWLFDYVGTANITRMFEAMLYAVKRHGVNVIFIDSLFKCGIGSDDYNAQKDFIAKLCDFARDTGAHVFLVAHTRKPPINTGGRNEDRVPSKDEIAGSGDIQNGAFNILIVWRNKEKHKKLDELRASGTPSMEAVAKWEAAPDGRVKLDKARFDGVEREVATWFDLASTQFTLARDERPTTYFRHSPSSA